MQEKNEEWVYEWGKGRFWSLEKLRKNEIQKYEALKKKLEAFMKFPHSFKRAALKMKKE